ncbi:unnamed protein product [Sphagnum jensenii]|uniref:Uncharacterized protein n=1 Tax=Sphagnum jensenii TaxID=128206 RepID=A0ABP1BPZ2_9BRYO
MAGRERPDCARIPDVIDLTFPHGKRQRREDEAAALPSDGDGRSRQIKLWEIAPEDGVASGVYNRAVKSLSASLARNNATAVIESSAEDVALVRCASEPGSRMEFGGLAQTFRLPVSAVARYVPLSSRKVITDPNSHESMMWRDPLNNDSLL